jgi:hypothetical protein
LSVVPATSAPPFQPLCHQRNVCHPFMNCLMWKTLPTINRKYFFFNILCNKSFCPQKNAQQNTALWYYTPHSMVAILTTETSPWTCACASAGLCCYVVIYKENLLHPLQLFYFHLWPIYWLSLIYIVKLSLYLIMKLSTTPWRHVRESRYSSTILDLSTRWRWVVSPLYIYSSM